MPFQKGQSGNPKGRPKKAERYAAPIAAAEDRIADRLPKILTNLEMLADGGWEQISETWEPAGLIFLEAPVLDKDGNQRFDANGEPITSRQKAFPDLEPEQLVCVRRVRSIAAPDRQANVYLVDRILGRPTQHVEGDVEHRAGDGLIEAFGAAVTKIYGSEESPS